MSPFLLSGRVQVVEDSIKTEKLHGSKRAGNKVLPAYPIPNLRRRTSVANHNTWHSNVDRSLYYGNDNWNSGNLRGEGCG